MKQKLLPNGGVSLLLFCLLSMAVFYACNKAESKKEPQTIEQKYLAEFIESDEFTQILASSSFLRKEDIDESQHGIIYHGGDQQKRIVSVSFKRNGQVYASLRGARVADAKIPAIGRKFLTLLLKYDDGFDMKSLSGSFEIIDTDNRNISVGRYKTGQGKILEDQSGKREVIASSSTPPTTEPPIILPTPERHLCDLNKDGNVSWAECYKCMIDACFSNAECAVQCFLYNVIYQRCTQAIDAACVIISIWY